MNLHAVSSDSPLPLYEQIKRVYEQQITSGQLREGEMLPADREICEQYGVSRITVVKALADLAQLGLVRRIQGKGTLVIASRVRRSLDDLAGFTELARRQGLRTRARLLSIELAGASAPREAESLADPGDGPVTRIHRLRYVNDQPAVITSSFVREAVAARMREHDLETGSFHQIFEAITGRRHIRTERALTVTAATAEIVALLQVPPVSAHFCFHTMTYLESDLLIEVAESIFRGDLFEFTAGMHRVRRESGRGVRRHS